MTFGDVYDVLQYGNPILYQKAAPVQDSTTPEIKSIVKKMIQTVESRQAVGLAAPQVGILLCIVVFRIPTETNNPRYVLTPEYDPEGVPMTALINPVFTPVSNKMQEEWEGCQSFPGIMAKVPRYHHINYTYTTLDGEKVSKEALGFHARAIQHECDHLDGILFPQRVTDIRKMGYSKELLQSSTS